MSADQAIANTRQLLKTNECGTAGRQNEITVCGRADSKYRLPLPTGRTPFADRVQGEVSQVTIDVAANRQCGVHAGQRRCSLRELRAYGYGGGSVPIRALVMLAKAAVDPDVEIGPLKGGPVTASERQ